MVTTFKNKLHGDRQVLKVTKTIGALVVESSGETPQKAAVDYIETNPRKLPQLRSLNPRGLRQVETTASPFITHRRRELRAESSRWVCPSQL